VTNIWRIIFDFFITLIFLIKQIVKVDKKLNVTNIWRNSEYMKYIWIQPDLTSMLCYVRVCCVKF
jgi:hypothetical protein